MLPGSGTAVEICVCLCRGDLVLEPGSDTPCSAGRHGVGGALH